MNVPFDSYAYSNRLRQLPPADRLSFAAVLLCCSLLFHTPAHLAILAWLFLWTVGYAGIPLRIYLKVLALPAGFLLLSLPALCFAIVPVENIAEVRQDALALMPLAGWAVYLSAAGCWQAVALFFRALAATACLYVVLFTVPLGEWLRVLRRIGVPLLVVELLLVMYRFVFVLWEVAGQLRTAQQARGGYGSFAASLRDSGRLVVQLFTRTCSATESG